MCRGEMGGEGSPNACVPSCCRRGMGPGRWEGNWDTWVLCPALGRERGWGAWEPDA